MESVAIRPEAPPRIEPSPGLGGREKSAGKWLLAVSLVAISVAGGAYIYSQRSPVAQYVTSRVDRGDIDSTVTTTGNLNAVITVQVGSQVSGNIIALYADFNTKVKKGQLVAEIDPAPFQASVDQATASLNAARAAVLTAQATLARSQADLATAQANVASQKANLVKTQSAVELARVGNERRKVMLKTGSTSQEDADTAQANFEQAVASVDAAQAAVHAVGGLGAIGAEGCRGGAKPVEPDQSCGGAGPGGTRTGPAQSRPHAHSRAGGWHCPIEEHGCRADRGGFVFGARHFPDCAGSDEDAGGHERG